MKRFGTSTELMQNVRKVVQKNELMQNRRYDNQKISVEKNWEK